MLYLQSATGTFLYVAATLVACKNNLSSYNKTNMQTQLKTPSLILSPDNYQARVMGCWLGKAVGGTLGMPFEGHDGPLDLDFYDPIPSEMLPNDDLDLQVVWACVLDQMDAPRVDRHLLSRAWLDHVEFPWDEYGVAIRNLKNGLRAPLSGSYDNWFSNGMGAPIRSEIWACLAPGNPALAAAYAYEDACVDHAGEGITGEMFFAALESLAFVESDTDALLDGALATLPPESLIRRAVEDTRVWWNEIRDWRAVRERILKSYGHENFTDATMNVAFTILGWLAGEGDFSRAICVAVNCGKDTDCTGATVGALMGILEPDGIPQRWLAPIGRDLVLSPGIVALDAPATLDDFTDLVLDLAKRLNGLWPQAQDFEQNASHLRVAAKTNFVDQMPPAAPITWLDGPFTDAISGTWATWLHRDFEQNVLLVEYPIYLAADACAIVMFNTHQACRIWLDGEFFLEHSGGVMAPSFHRAPHAQMREVHLRAGHHRLTVAVQRPQNEETAQWVIGVGDANTDQWIAEAFVSQAN